MKEKGVTGNSMINKKFNWNMATGTIDLHIKRIISG
jgi:hypothetical protein